MIIHTLDLDEKSYSRFLMKHHTLDLDEKSYSGLDKIQTLIWMKNHTLDFDDNPYPRFGWKIIL